jgi:DNA-directed RNA polymerase specialized sigma24 family protein
MINPHHPGVHVSEWTKTLRLVSDQAPIGARVAQEAAQPTLIDSEDLVHAQHARLYGALCLIIRDRGEAEDVMQEAFLKVWERWNRVQEMENPAGYLYRTALNLHRKRRRRASVAIRRAVGLDTSRDSFADVETRDAVGPSTGGAHPEAAGECRAGRHAA